MFSTSGDNTSTSGGYYEYIREILGVHGGGVLSMSGAYHEYIGDVQYIGGIP